MSVRAQRDTVLEGIAVLHELSELFVARRGQLAARAGLTEAQWQVLEEISTEHFIPSMFARSRASSAAAVSKILRQLLDKDLVRVSVSATDGRQRDYELSAAGRRVLQQLRADRERAIDAIWSALPQARLRAFNDVASTLVERIRSYASEEATDKRGVSHG